MEIVWSGGCLTRNGSTPAQVKLMIMTLLDKGAKSDTCVLRSSSEFLYYFRRWCEDDKRNEIAGESPTTRIDRQCELFVLFIGSLPVASVEAHAQKLVTMLRDAETR